ncbi:MAG: annexin [Bacteroidales bacterium]|jgi:hypothetical protein|nr:annexin [Bacteroidales bacterium]
MTEVNSTKPLIVVGCSGVAGFFLWKIVKKYMDNAPLRKQEKALEQANKVDASKLTISTAEATLIAEKLYAAMDGMGTDSKAIMSLLIGTARTDDDLKLINKSFGIREYGSTGSPYWGSGTPSDLSTWLRNELSGSDLEKLRVRFTSAGIPF